MRTVDITAPLTRAGGEVLDQFDSGPPDELFHYTDTSGLIGILAGKGELWATDARCMNDTDELTLGNSLLEKAIRAQSTHPAHRLLDRLLTHPAYLSGMVFVSSFSPNPDLLSQWRSYADDGAGYAVGFRSAELSNLAINGKPVPKYLVRVEYDPSAQQSRARRVIERMLSTLAPLVGKSLDDQDEQLLATGLGLVLPTLSAACKNDGFREESEHRIVLQSNQDPLLALGAKPELTMAVVPLSFRKVRRHALHQASSSRWTAHGGVESNRDRSESGFSGRGAEDPDPARQRGRAILVQVSDRAGGGDVSLIFGPLYGEHAAHPRFAAGATSLSLGRRC